jgi:hypothetical protein
MPNANSAAMKSLDRLHSRVVVAMGKRKCVTCGDTTTPTCSHIFGRAQYATRWDTGPKGNCHVQCAACNLHHSDVSREPYEKWYIKTYGKRAFVRLKARAKTPMRLKAVIVNRREALKELARALHVHH